jgi:methionyl-tRNA formyltransferase
MRLVFLGTPEPAVPSLEALVAAGHEVVCVVTRPDRRRGRGSELSPSPVKEAALALALPVVHHVRELEGIDADWGVVVAYGAMIPAAVLARLPMLNVHFSILPRWRGAAPVERAILAGDSETGVGIMSLEETLDTGPVHGELRVPVGEKTASKLTAELAHRGAALLVDVLASPERLQHARAQKGAPTYAEKLSSDTFHLSPTMTVVEAGRIVRLERAWCHVAGKRFRVLSAHQGEGADDATAGSVVAFGPHVGLAVADGVIWLDRVQPEGGRPMEAAAWWAGARLASNATWS